MLIYSMYFIKSPVYGFIYYKFNNCVIAFLLAFVISLFISKVIHKLFKNLLRIKRYDSILKLPIVYSIPVLYCKVRLNVFYVVYYNSG